MRLIPSIHFEDAAGVAHAIDIPHIDTLDAQERGIDRALAEAMRQNAIHPRIQIYDADTGRLLIRRSINFKGNTNVKA